MYIQFMYILYLYFYLFKKYIYIFIFNVIVEMIGEKVPLCYIFPISQMCLLPFIFFPLPYFSLNEYFQYNILSLPLPYQLQPVLILFFLFVCLEVALGLTIHTSTLSQTAFSHLLPVRVLCEKLATLLLIPFLPSFVLTPSYISLLHVL